jgi:hypothetical protein
MKSFTFKEQLIKFRNKYRNTKTAPPFKEQLQKYRNSSTLKEQSRNTRITIVYEYRNSSTYKDKLQ